MWSDFNEANKSAMMKSELISWPVTLAILLLAFGSLVAAGLPLLLTILGLMASAGSLFLITHLFDVSIWAMNFALMFALALGIDYALFIVARFRGAHFGSQVTTSDAVAVTMDTAGKAVLFSGVTVLISLSAVMLVPSPAFRSMALGIMLSVAFILLATLTLLPAVLAWLGSRVDRLALPWVHAGEHRSPRFARWGERLWRHPALFGIPAAAILVLLALPVLRLDTGMPSIKVVPKTDGSRVGYTQIQEAFGPGAPGTLQVVSPAADAARVQAVLEADPGIVAVAPAQRSGDHALVLAVPAADPSDPSVGATVDRLRSALPAGRARRGRRRREPRSRGGARDEDASRLRRRPRPRLPAPPRRPAGTADRPGGCADEPARHRGGVRRRRPDLPGRQPAGPPRLRVAGLPERVGAGVLLRDDLRDLDGLHRLSALVCEGALGPFPATRARRWSAAWPTPAARSSPPRP